MDLPPWGKFREKVIENQARYDNPEFQNDYASNFSVNFQHDPMKALIFENGQIMVSPLMDRHLSDINNMSMKKPFADKYPEFRDVCRFEEVWASNPLSISFFLFPFVVIMGRDTYGINYGS